MLHRSSPLQTIPLPIFGPHQQSRGIECYYTAVRPFVMPKPSQRVLANARRI